MKKDVLFKMLLNEYINKEIAVEAEKVDGDRYELVIVLRKGAVLGVLPSEDMKENAHFEAPEPFVPTMTRMAMENAVALITEKIQKVLGEEVHNAAGKETDVEAKEAAE